MTEDIAKMWADILDGEPREDSLGNWRVQMPVDIKFHVRKNEVLTTPSECFTKAVDRAIASAKHD